VLSIFIVQSKAKNKKRRKTSSAGRAQNILAVETENFTDP